MIYRSLGATGIEASAIGFGTMRFPDPLDREQAAELVVYAFDRGINYFDTAPKYCHDKSEIIMGDAVLEMKKRKKPFYLSSKSMARKEGDLLRDLERSLSRLKVDALDLFHVWCVMSREDMASRRGAGVLKDFRRAREEGLFRHAALSTHMTGADIRLVLEEEDFESLLLGYSAVNFPYREEGLAAAADKGMGVVVMNPLGGGTIMNNPDVFDFIRIRPEQTLLEGALHFLLSDPRITVNLVGFSNKKQVDEALNAVETFRPYKAEETENVKKRVKEDFHNLCTTCLYCDLCPVGIPVWKFMESYNFEILNDEHTAADRMKWHWGVKVSELEACTECRRCEEACTQHLPVLERFAKLKELAGQ